MKKKRGDSASGMVHINAVRVSEINCDLTRSSGDSPPNYFSWKEMDDRQL